MKRVEVNGIGYALPFADLLPPFTTARLDELRADVATHGVLQSVVIATTPTWGRIVVEGMHRSLVAEALDLDVPVTNLGHLTDAAARERCLALNLKRRHMTLEEQQTARGERIRRVTEARSQGYSLGVIAQREHVSKTQIARDLQESEQVVTGVTTTEIAPAPEHVITTTGTVRRTKPKPRVTLMQRAHSGVDGLAMTIRAILKSNRRGRLETIAAAAGIPLSGNTWPALEQIRAVLRDVANGGVQT